MSIRFQSNSTISTKRKSQDDDLVKFEASGRNSGVDIEFHESCSEVRVLQDMVKEMGNVEDVYWQLKKQNFWLQQQQESLLGQFSFYEQEIEKLEDQRCQQEHIVKDMINKAKFLHEVLDEARMLSEDRDHIITVKNLYIDQLMNTLEMMLESNMHLREECTYLQKELKSLEVTRKPEWKPLETLRPTQGFRAVPGGCRWWPEVAGSESSLNGLEPSQEIDVQPETPRTSSFIFCFPFLHRKKSKAPKDRSAHGLKSK
ncbi:uncharacterized protein LOC129705171 isoform X2 [Leucoraja erinacea]|uniref:uncharacterized protein LOC129705171 isoform X2 n=1 Tax=Leucoraja erinaceus TaxID=7782 RepID=UPI0024589606|nr:uncharacterized protein LOC129705171 isoform X2 [Leucoraja erinacea]